MKVAHKPHISDKFVPGHQVSLAQTLSAAVNPPNLIQFAIPGIFMAPGRPRVTEFQ